MKKLLYIVLILIMALSAFGGATAKTAKARDNSGDSLTDAEMILFIPAGENEDEAGYLIENEGNTVGPESFAVYNGNVYLLDTVKNRVIAYENGIIRSIPINGIYHPDLIAFAGNSFYLIDETCMISADVNGNNCREVALPEEITPSDIYRIYEENGNLCMLTHELQSYVLEHTTEKWIKSYEIGVEGRFEQTETFILPEKKIELEVGETCLVQFIQQTESEIIVGVYEFVPYLPVIETEYTVRKYNLQGELMGCTVINNLEAYSLPNTAACLDAATGIVYTMLCREEGVYITRPNLRMTYESHMEELTAIAEGIIGSSKTINQTRNTTLTNKTRQEVLSRANDAWSYQWELLEANRDTDGLSDPVLLPCQITAADIGDTIDSIPYCFGGYFTDIQTGFENRLSSSVTGNTIHNHVEGTIGLDCSGFVSFAYNISYHSSLSFSNYGYYVNGNESSSIMSETCGLANLEQMDFLVYTAGQHGNHVLLFHSLTNDGRIKTRESTTMNNNGETSTTKHGVKIRTVNIDVLNGYVLHTPYACGGTAGHSMSEYQHDASKHWKECIWGCGEITDEASHTWSGYHHSSSKHWKECTSGCGEITSEASHTWSGYKHNEEQHWKKCTVCGRKKNQADHVWSAYSYDSTNHSRTCNTCAYTQTAPHIFEYQYNNFYHWQRCTENCGYRTENSLHNWVPALNGGYRCTSCGATSAYIPTPGSIYIEQEAE